MLIAVVVLVVTNLVGLAVLVRLRGQRVGPPAPDPAVAAALDRSPRPPGVSADRLLISIEILNPIELAGTRGRLAGLAGTLAPRLTRRIVYDQTVKVVKAQLAEQHAVADVRVHTLRAVPGTSPLVVVDEVDDGAEPER